MDANARQSLDRRFHYGFLAMLAVGVSAVVGLAWLLAPGDVVFFTIAGLPVVLFLGAASIAVATGQRAGAGTSSPPSAGVWCSGGHTPPPDCGARSAALLIPRTASTRA